MSFKLLLLQLGFTCSTAADRLRLILSDSQCLREFNRGFPLLFFSVVFTSERAEICRHIRKISISRLFWSDR